MQRPDQTLRPLGLGEVLDRAVTLCVAHFVPLAIIFLVYAIPYAVVQYLATQDLARVMSAIGAAMQTQGTRGPAGDASSVANMLRVAPRLNGWYPLLLTMAFFVGPLPAAALIVACSKYYFGRATTLGEAYRIALLRWLPLVGINLLYAVAGIMVYALVIMLGIALALALAFVVQALHGIGIALAVLVGVVVGVGSLAFLIVVVLAVQVSYFTCVLEGAGSIAAFARGLRRVFVGVGLVRSLLVGVAYATIAVGIAIVALVGDSLLAGLFHNAAAGTAYSTIVRVATAAFMTAFIAIFYYDLRVREEGLDLLVAADAALER